MQSFILQASGKKQGLVFDPRTKLLLLLTMAIFVLGGIGEADGIGKPVFLIISACLCVLPGALLLASKQIKAAAIYAAAYLLAQLAFIVCSPNTRGLLHFLLLGTMGILTKFLPSIVLGAYVVSTTTVSEFTAAMLRMHVSEKLIIPLSVMFRFFPTVVDEFRCINAAMRMRGIYFAGKHAGKMLEYRVIPLIICSVKIGEELSAAALTRGLGGTVRRTNVCEIGCHLQDVFAIIFCALAYVCLVLSWFNIL